VVLPGQTLELGTGDLGPGAPEGSRYEAALDGGLIVPVPDGRLKMPTEGDHWLAVITRDREGVASPARWWRIQVEKDETPPEIQWKVVSAGATLQGRDGNPVYGPPVVVEVTAKDDRAGVERLEWSVSGGAVLPLDPATGPARFETQAPKVHIAAFDGAGNKGFVELVWGVDWEPPQFLLRLEDGTIAPPGEVVKVRQGTVATLEALDFGVGVATESHALGGVWQNTLGTIVFGTPGKTTLEARAADRAGNEIHVEWPVKVKKVRGSRSGGGR
jgi:hypothetical protein